MHTRTGIVLAALAAAALFVSAQGGEAPWAGPHPHQLVSYHFTISLPNARGVWSPPVTILSPVPGSGLVITRILTQGTTGTADRVEYRLMENTTTQKYWRVSTGNLEDAVDVDLGSGLVIQAGTLTMQARNITSNGQSIAVTITGYVN